MLCSTLQTIVNDELRYAGTLEYENDRVVGFSSVRSTPTRTRGTPVHHRQRRPGAAGRSEAAAQQRYPPRAAGCGGA